MTAHLFYAPIFRPLSIAGGILPNAYVQFYLSGTTTPTDVYADADLQTPLDNPVVADDDGHFPPIYLDRSISYRAQIYDADDVLQPDGDIDPLGTSLDHPPGTVVMFFGDATARDAAYPPALWQICNGSSGSPDLRGRFPRSIDTGIAAGDTGGAASGNTGADGAHDHGGATSAEALSVAQMPEHHHGVLADTQSASTEVVGLGNAGAYSVGGRTAVFAVAPVDDAPGSGEQIIEDVGGGDTHAHDITAASTHTHTFSTLPPWCALWFLMRKA